MTRRMQTPKRRAGRRASLIGAAAGVLTAVPPLPPATPARGRASAHENADAHRRFVAVAVAARDRAVAAGDQPYGAAIVRDGQLVVAMPSRVVASNDPTAHAEMEAIREAARRLGTRDLRGTTLYGSSPACPMCEAAAYWAGVSRLVHGDPPVDAGAPRLPQRPR